ncbi:glycoside hydrolase family 28 protein [Dactylosporangium siamense]|uniref:Glycoside hydrolase n=1 Tax=Dactylosporangium siamense TaxID=685454 RepID=A0A919PMU4_9ACTN|nr:glycosyl hydrolase family 28 protein [Dactylosporangium siamense]GIG45038.1 glycoside hydrolase [Dactylosporangium siamense]
MSSTSLRRWLAVLAAACLAGIVAPTLPAAAAGVFNVRDYGAAGNGSANDTPAINRAIAAANAAGGGTVRLTAGTYRSANSIHLLSNVTLQLDSGSTILGAAGTGYDPAEPNPNDAYQDFGHSHFHNAMIWGDRLSNIGITGAGTIDGGGFLKIHENDLPDPGEADKILALTRCTNLRLDGITLRRGGHFAALVNGCDGVQSAGLRIDTASDRDGWNVINTRNVVITDVAIAAQDDALAFKSDWALGQRFQQGHVRVTGARLSAVCCNALNFGSETCSDFSDYVFDTVTITGANKAGLGMVSMDGANISDVHYRNITISGVAAPIFQKIGTRKRCGDNPGVGSIHDITYENVTATGKGPQTPTLWGADATHRISGVTFTDVDVFVPGGSANLGTAVPTNDPNAFNPASIGTRPAFGWYLHNADGIHFTGGSAHFTANDNRPAVIADAGSSVTFDRFVTERGSGSPYDTRFQSIAGYCVSNGTNTTGGATRVSQTGSTQNCAAPLTITGVTVAGWSVQPELRTGVTQYGDRTYTFASVPAGLAGAQWIRTTNDSRTAATDPLVRFTVNRAVTVSVAVDTRRGRLPWMGSSWTDTGTQITNTESPSRSFAVYSSAFPAGQIALGPNAEPAKGSSMYTVVVR